MSALTGLQRTLLRGWAMNMRLAGRISRPRAMGFDYTAAEEARFRAIAESVPSWGFAAWLVAAIVLYALIALPPLILMFSRFGALPLPVGMGLTLLIGLVALPLSLVSAAWIVDRVFHLPPFEEAGGDAELCAKIRGQIAWVASIALASAVVIAAVQAARGNPG